MGQGPGHWGRLHEVWRHQGLAGIWFGSLARTCYRRLLFFERLLVVAAGEPSRLAVHVRRLEEADLDAFRGLRPPEEGLFLQRLAKGEQCWGAWCDGRLRHVFWVAVGEAWIDYLHRVLPLGPQEAYCYGLFTHPQWRGLGLSAAGAWISAKELGQAGFERMLSAALPENRPGVRAMRKAGYRRIGVMGYAGWGRWRRQFYIPDKGSIPPMGLMPAMETRPKAGSPGGDGRTPG